jgi:very-short-patch-repair endonuclease
MKAPPRPEPLTGHARALRRAQTAAERTLWARLRNSALGVKIRRQVPIGPFIADFACESLHLIIELDGNQHANDTARAYDARRTSWLQAKGYLVMRFSNHETLTTTDNIVATIWHTLQTLSRTAGEGRLGEAERGEGAQS